MSFKPPNFPSQDNPNLQLSFTLKNVEQNQKVYICYRNADSESQQQFVSYEMTYTNFTYQRNLLLDKRTNYEYHYQIEVNGKITRESGNRSFIFSERSSYEMDEWNTVQVNYVFETKQGFNKTDIDLIRDGVKLRLRKQNLQFGNNYIYQQRVPLDQQDFQQLSFMLDGEVFKCDKVNKITQMNKIFYNFDSTQLYQDAQKISEIQKKIQKAKEELSQRQRGLQEETDKLQKSLLEYQQLNEEYLQSLTYEQNIENKKENENEALRNQIEELQTKYQDMERELRNEIQNEQKRIQQFKELSEKQSRSQDENINNLKQQQEQKKKELEQWKRLTEEKQTALLELEAFNKTLKKQFDEADKTFKKQIWDYEVMLNENQATFVEIKKKKESELNIYKEKKEVEINELKEKLFITSRQLQDFRKQLQQQGIQETKIPELCHEIFMDLPQDSDLFETLKSYESKIKLLNQSLSDTQEQIQQYDEKIVQQATEKKKICEDCNEQVKQLEAKIDKLISNLGDTQQVSDQKGLKINQLKDQLKNQIKQFKQLQENYALLESQLGEQLKVNQQLLEQQKQAKAEFEKQYNQIQQEQQKQEENYKRQREQLENKNQEYQSQLEKQKEQIKQQEDKLKEAAQINLQEYAQNIKQKEDEINKLQIELNEAIQQRQKFEENNLIAIQQKEMELRKEQENKVYEKIKEVQEEQKKEINRLRKLQSEKEEKEKEERYKKNQELEKKIEQLEKDLKDAKVTINEKEQQLKVYNDPMNSEKISFEEKKIYLECIEEEKRLKQELAKLNNSFKNLAEITNESNADQVAAFLKNIQDFCANH